MGCLGSAITRLVTPPAISDASDVDYDNSTSGLAATDVQAAIDEIVAESREVLQANRTYYVRTDGSDGNTGLVDSSGGAFLTVQNAVDVARALDLGVYQVTIQFDGTFAEDVVVGPFVGGATVPLILKGSGYTTATLGAGGVAFTAHGAVSVSIGAFSCAAGVIGVEAEVDAYVIIDQGTMSFDAQSARFIDINTGGKVDVNNDIRLTGNTARGFFCRHGSYISFAAGGAAITVYVPAAIAVSVGFMVCVRNSIFVRSNTVTFNLTGGSVTGTRYSAVGVACIDTAGAGATFFPGTIAGAVSSGGVYI